MSHQIKRESIPAKATRKLDNLFCTTPLLNQNQDLQNKIIDWAEEMLYEALTEWHDLHTTILDAVILCDRKSEAIKRGKARDKRYAPFRAFFKDLQQKKFTEYQKQGKILTANSFVVWFLEYVSDNIEIPYTKSNLRNKLIQLAQENNREFKKAFECKS